MKLLILILLSTLTMTTLQFIDAKQASTTDNPNGRSFVNCSGDWNANQLRGPYVVKLYQMVSVEVGGTTYTARNYLTQQNVQFDPHGSTFEFNNIEVTIDYKFAGHDLEVDLVDITNGVIVSTDDIHAPWTP